MADTANFAITSLTMPLLPSRGRQVSFPGQSLFPREDFASSGNAILQRFSSALHVMRFPALVYQIPPWFLLPKFPLARGAAFLL